MSDVLSDLPASGLIAKLAAAAGDVDRTGAWPATQFAWFAETGVLEWVIPASAGGSELSQPQIVQGYELLASACLTSTFILTQRNGACQRIAACDNEELKAEVLPLLARGVRFATVGISHLTTSRQHLKTPAVQVVDRGNCFELNGQVPWVTGAGHADYVVTGGTYADGRQVLIAVPTELPGISIGDPAHLLALTASQTASIDLDGVMVDRRWLLAGPVHGVMGTGTGGGTGSVATSAIAVGLAARAVGHLRSESNRRPELLRIVGPFEEELQRLRDDLVRATDESCSGEVQLSAASIRQRANSFCLRSTQAMLAASKGAGFVAGHPAEQAVREAMFFLVWSCPQPVLAAALDEFACLTD